MDVWSEASYGPVRLSRAMASGTAWGVGLLAVGGVIGLAAALAARARAEEAPVCMTCGDYVDDQVCDTREFESVEPQSLHLPDAPFGQKFTIGNRAVDYLP